MFSYKNWSYGMLCYVILYMICKRCIYNTCKLVHRSADSLLVLCQVLLSAVLPAMLTLALNQSKSFLPALRNTVMQCPAADRWKWLPKVEGRQDRWGQWCDMPAWNAPLPTYPLKKTLACAILKNVLTIPNARLAVGWFLHLDKSHRLMATTNVHSFLLLFARWLP